MDRTCATCLWYRREPGVNRAGYGACFKKHVFDGYGWTKAENTCKDYFSRSYVRNGKDAHCACCDGPVDESDQYCRHCGIEFTRGKR